MRLRNIPGSRETIAASEFVVHEDVMREKKGNWNTVFGNTNPICIEVGMEREGLSQSWRDRTRIKIMSGSKNIQVCCCVRWRSGRRCRN